TARASTTTCRARTWSVAAQVSIRPSSSVWRSSRYRPDSTTPAVTGPIGAGSGGRELEGDAHRPRPGVGADHGPDLRHDDVLAWRQLAEHRQLLLEVGSVGVQEEDVLHPARLAHLVGEVAQRPGACAL